MLNWTRSEILILVAILDTYDSPNTLYSLEISARENLEDYNLMYEKWCVKTLWWHEDDTCQTEFSVDEQ